MGSVTMNAGCKVRHGSVNQVMLLDRFEEIDGKRMAMCQAVQLEWPQDGSFPIGCHVMEGAFDPAELAVGTDADRG